MVTTKRQMKVENDRYGGYNNESVQADSLTLPSDIDEESVDITLSGRRTEEPSILRTESAVTQQAEQAATTTVSPSKPRTELPKRPAKEKKKLRAEDIMPSIKTRAYMTNSEETEQEEELVEIEDTATRPVGERFAMSRRTKVAALIYIAVAVALAIAVISVGVSISQTSASVDALTASIAQKQAVLAAGEAELASKLDEDVIRQAAQDLGMVQAGDPSIDVPSVEKSNYPTPEVHTNAFDKFCDWLAGILL